MHFSILQPSSAYCGILQHLHHMTSLASRGIETHDEDRWRSMKIDEDRWSRLICSGVGCDKRWQEVNIRAVLCDRCWPRWEDRLPVVWPEPDNRRWLGWQVSACGSSAGWMPGQRYLTTRFLHIFALNLLSGSFWILIGTKGCHQSRHVETNHHVLHIFVPWVLGNLV